MTRVDRGGTRTGYEILKKNMHMLKYSILKIKLKMK